MLIALVGPKCAGKGLVAKILSEHLQCERLDSLTELERRGGLERCWHQSERLVIRRLNAEEAEKLYKRPFCLLVAVDAPRSVRFNRNLDNNDGSGAISDVNDFFLQDDSILYTNGLSKWMREAPVKIWNGGSEVALESTVLQRNLIDKRNLRPTWDLYFLGIANLLAERNNCRVKKSAAVIVRDNRVVSTGYAGTPKGYKYSCLRDAGCSHCATSAPQNPSLSLVHRSESRKGGDPSSFELASSDAKLAMCICLCAEESAIIEAGRTRCGGGSIYISGVPCVSCAKKIRQSGITRVIMPGSLEAFSRQAGPMALVSNQVKMEFVKFP